MLIGFVCPYSECCYRSFYDLHQPLTEEVLSQVRTINQFDQFIPASLSLDYLFMYQNTCLYTQFVPINDQNVLM